MPELGSDYSILLFYLLRVSDSRAYKYSICEYKVEVL